MKRLFFKCLIKIGDLRVLAIQSLSNSSYFAPLEEGTNKECFGITLGLKSAAKDGMTIFFWDANIIRAIQLGAGDPSVKDAIMTFVKNNYKFSGKPLSDTDYFVVKKELFDLLALINDYKKSDPEDNTFDILYKTSPDPNSQTAADACDKKTLIRFLDTGTI